MMTMSDEEKKDEENSDLTDLDLDDDLASALSQVEEEISEADLGKLEDLLEDADPSFSKDLESISSDDFAGVVIEKGSAADAVNEGDPSPTAFKAFLTNLPQEQKNRYSAAVIVVMVMIPLAILIYMGKILPKFELPYYVSMNEITQDVQTYPTDGVMVPLFDEFRSKAFTFNLPKTMINLKTADGNSAYGNFEFFLNLRDESDAVMIEEKQSEIIDMLQRVLEQVTWRELQSPIGKEKVKKIIRHQINQYMQANVVIGVYYRSVLLSK